MPRKSSRRSLQGDLPDHDPEATKGERLQKVLAAAGIASRRECETLIRDGRVEVDGQTVTVLGTRVEPHQQEIRVDGTVLPKPRHVYYLVNKPAGVVSTSRDPQRRARVVDLVPAHTRLFTIGRLDRSSEGMIILTNDGELTNQLTHPRYGIAKTYRALVVGSPTAETIDKLRQGVHLAEGVARVASLTVRNRRARGTELEIVLTEGRNREIRRILAKVGHKVQQLRRVAIGPIRLGRMAPGEYRLLSLDEVRQLRQAVQPLEGTAREKSAAKSGRGPAGPSRAARVRANQAAARSGKRAAPAGKGKKVKKKSPTGVWKPAKKATREGTVLDYDQSAKSAGTQGKGKKAGAKRKAGAKQDRRSTSRPGTKAGKKGKHHR